jgi:hypothetical protein
MEKNYSIMFICISCVLFLFFAVGLVQSPNGPQRMIFFRGADDFFADFFNILLYNAGRDPYFGTNTVVEYRGSYLPLSYLILYPFSQLDNFGMMTLQDAWNSKLALMSAFLYNSFLVYLLIMSLNMICKKFHVSSSILISLVLSYIFFYSVERANIIILSAAFTGFFICYYDSKNKYERVLAAISLAMAATLKIYPVLFGFLYFQKKQYREIILSASLTLSLIFLPFLFFKNGFAGFPEIFSNLRLLNNILDVYFVTERFSFAHFVFFILAMLEFPPRIIEPCTSIVQISEYFLCSISIIFSVLVGNKWLKISLVTMTVLFLPAISSLYCGLYAFPMIVLFFSTLEERSKSFNIFTLIVFIIFLNPYQFNFGYMMSFNYLICNVALLSFWLVLLVYSGRQIAASKVIFKFKASIINKISDNK